MRPALWSRLGLSHGLMVLAGLGAFLSSTEVLRDRSLRVEVLIAGEPMERGAAIGPGRAGFTSIRVPAGSDLVHSLVSPDAVPSGVLMRALQVGDPLLRSDIGVGLGDQRTMSIPVDRAGVAGLGLESGDLVDVISRRASGEASFTALGLMVVRTPPTSTSTFGGRFEADFVTVEVDARQALALVEAIDEGDLHLLRSTAVGPVDLPTRHP